MRYSQQREIIKEILQISDISIQVGGGIRSISKVEAMLEMGVSRIILGTALFQDNFIKDLKNNFDSKVTADIAKLFEYTLDRLPDEDGFNYFYEKLITGQLSLSDVKSQIEQSSEYLSLHPLKLN